MGRYWGHQKVSFGGLESSLFPVKKGGLGIQKLSSFNQALIGKWLWKAMIFGEGLFM